LNKPRSVERGNAQGNQCFGSGIGWGIIDVISQVLALSSI
jgi:hypothetical protein